jgi:hypothetical protein
MRHSQTPHDGVAPNLHKVAEADRPEIEESMMSPGAPVASLAAIATLVPRDPGLGIPTAPETGGADFGEALALLLAGAIPVAVAKATMAPPDAGAVATGKPTDLPDPTCSFADDLARDAGPEAVATGDATVAVDVPFTLASMPIPMPPPPDISHDANAADANLPDHPAIAPVALPIPITDTPVALDVPPDDGAAVALVQMPTQMLVSGPTPATPAKTPISKGQMPDPAQVVLTPPVVPFTDTVEKTPAGVAAARPDQDTKGLPQPKPKDRAPHDAPQKGATYRKAESSVDVARSVDVPPSAMPQQATTPIDPKAPVAPMVSPDSPAAPMLAVSAKRAPATALPPAMVMQDTPQFDGVAAAMPLDDAPTGPKDNVPAAAQGPSLAAPPIGPSQQNGAVETGPDHPPQVRPATRPTDPAIATAARPSAPDLQMPVAAAPERAVDAQTGQPTVAFVQAVPPPAPRSNSPAGDALRLDAPDWETTLGTQIATRLTETGQQIDIDLSPERLGRLTIRLDLADGQAQVVIMTDGGEAARLFQQSEHRLSDALSRAGLTLSSLETGSRGAAGGLAQDGRGGQSGRHQDQAAGFGRRAPTPHPAIEVPRRVGAGLVNILA